MTTKVLTLEVERAGAEAMSRTLRNWEPSKDRADVACQLENCIRTFLDTPGRLKAVVQDALAFLPSDEPTSDAVERYREGLSACFRITLDVLRTIRDMVEQSEQHAYPVPSLHSLVQIIAEVEQSEAHAMTELAALEVDAPISVSGEPRG